MFVGFVKYIIAFSEEIVAPHVRAANLAFVSIDDIAMEPEPSSSNNVMFFLLLLIEETVNSQSIDIYRLGLPQRNFFSHQPPNHPSLLYPMTRKTRHIDPVIRCRHAAKNWIVVRRHFIISPPASPVIQSHFRQP